MKTYFAAVFNFIVLCLLSISSYVVANNPAKGLILIDKRAGLVRFFDADIYQEISNLKIDGIPHELVLSPDRKTAYIPNYGDGVYGNNPNPGQSIAVIDLEARQIRHTIDISPYQAPHGVEVDSNGILYVSCDLSRKLLVIDPTSFEITSVIDTVGTGHWVSVLPDGSKAYTANKQDKLFVSVIDIQKEKVIGEVPMPNGTQGIAISPDGKTVLAMDMTEPKIKKIDTKTDRVVEDIFLPGHGRGVWDAEYSPDGQYVTVINVRDRIATIFKADNFSNPLATLAVGSQPFGIEYTPDSSTVLVSNHGDGTISVIDLATLKVTSTFIAGTGIETLAFY